MRADNMNLLHTFNEENASEAEISTYKIRQAARAIVFDADNKVALLYIAKHDYYELPGGGVEEDETIEEACIRECKEEIGCNVEIISEVGKTIEYRKQLKRVNVSFCYVAKVIGEKGISELQEDEIEMGTSTVWVSKEKALELIEERLENSEDLHLYDKYIVQRSIVLLNAIK